MKKETQHDRSGRAASHSQGNALESAARYVELFEHAPVAYFTLQRGGKITQTNRAGALLLNVRASQLSNTSFGDYVSESSRPAFDAFLGQVFNREFRPSCQVELNTEGSAPATVHVEATLSPDDSECWAVMTDVTQQKVVDFSQSESEKRYKTLIEHTPFCVHEIDLEGRFESVNRSGLKMLEVDREQDVCGTSYLAAVCKNDLPRIERLLAAAFGGEANNFEFTTAGEPALSIKSCFVPIRDDAGKVIRILGISEDVTKRRHAEDTVRTSNQLLEATQTIGKLGGWELDLTTSKLFWTAETYRIHDTSPEEFNPTVDAGVSYFLPESRAIITTALEAAIQRGEGYDLELETLTTKGRRIDVRTTCVVTTQDGAPNKLTGIFQDITDQKRTESALRENQAKLQLAVQAAHIGPWSWDLLTDEVYFSPEWKKQIGYEDHELANEFSIWVEHIHPKDRERILDAVRNFRDDPTINGYSVDFRFRHKNGSYRWIHTRAILLFDSGGQPVRMLGAHMDFTDRKLAEDSLLRTQRLESLGTLAGGVAHDLNNALAPILMGTELLRIEYPEASKTADLFEASALRGAGMVRQLLAFAKGAEGERVGVNFGLLVKEMETLMRGTFPKNIDIQIQLAPLLPSVLGDATQLHRILLNLCVNARDAMPDGGTLSVKTETLDVDANRAGCVYNAQPGKYVAVEVSDTGIGIPPETMDRIFDPFFTTKGPQEGTGLGLSTVMGIVRSHGGFLEVSSQPGEVTKIAVYLPAKGETGEPQPSSVSDTSFRGNGGIVLFVDDEESLRTAAFMTLQHLGFRPLTAVDGADGLSQALDHRDSLTAIILDLHMPRMSGLEFVSELREFLPAIPILVSSGRMDSEVVAKFGNMQVYDFLDKPFTMGQLADAIETLFRPGELPEV